MPPQKKSIHSFISKRNFLSCQKKVSATQFSTPAFYTVYTDVAQLSFSSAEAPPLSYTLGQLREKKQETVTLTVLCCCDFGMN